MDDARDPRPAPDSTPLAILTAPPSRQSVAALEIPALIDRYAYGVNCLDRRVLELSDEDLDTFFRPEAGVGRWSCRVLVGHLADTELVQVHRMRRMFSEEAPVVALWDENAFIDSGLYAPREGAGLPVAGSVGVIHTLRLWTTEWLRALPEDGWGRRCLHPEEGELILRDQLVKTTWHLEHHAWFLRRKIERLRGG